MFAPLGALENSTLQINYNYRLKKHICQVLLYAFKLICFIKLFGYNFLTKFNGYSK